MALQPQVDLLEKRLKELKGEKRCEDDPSAFLDADIDAFKERYAKVLEDLRARERQLQLGRRITTKPVRFFLLRLHPPSPSHHSLTEKLRYSLQSSPLY